MTLRAILHLALHFAVPALLAWIAYRDRWLRAWLTMMATMAIDLDHLLSSPLYDPNRCSIGFHPLHTWPAVVVYGLLVFPMQTRLIGLGLIIHLLLDGADCIFMR